MTVNINVSLNKIGASHTSSDTNHKRTKTVESKNIYQRINAVMNDCEYIQKKQAQQGKGVKYDEVNAMLRKHLVNHGIAVVMNQQGLTQISSLKNKDGSEGSQKIYQGEYTMDLVNIDNPDDKVTYSTSAHGMDGGDKAPGKAHTYAAKLMLTKAFGIETGEDEESRAEKMEKLKTIDNDQFKQLSKYCIENDRPTAIGLKLLTAYKISHFNQLPASKFTEALTRAEKAYTLAMEKQKDNENVDNK